MSHMSDASQAQSQDEKLNFKQILPIFIIVLVDILGLTVILPLLPLYAAAFGADAIAVGALSAAYPLLQLVGSPLLGGLSDRVGRRPVLLVSQIGTFIGFLILGFANTLPLLFLARIIDGFTGGNIVVAQAAITDSTTARTRAQGLGLIGAAFGIGFTLGPAIAGVALVLTDNNYTVPAFIAAGFSLLSILLTAFWFKETLPEERRGQSKGNGTGGNIVGRSLSALRNPLIGGLLLLMFMQQLVFGGVETLLSLFTFARLGMNGASNTLLFLFIGIILVFVQGKYIGPLSRRFGERKLIYAGALLLGLGVVFTAVTPEVPVPWYSRADMLDELAHGTSMTVNVPLPPDDQVGWLGFVWIAVSLIPVTIGGGLISPSINSLITRRSPSSEAGQVLGVSSSLLSLANAITPLIGGALFQFFGSTAPFLVGGLLMLALALWAMRSIGPGPEEQTMQPVHSAA
jgi:DHA1 family tetracycline resistance protein-like MFS transporter